MVKNKIRLIAFFAVKDEKAVYSQPKTRFGANCSSAHQFFIAKFRLKLKKVEKSTSPFRYDLNQIPYDYTVEVTNRFKGLDLVNRVTEKLWMEVCNTEQETVTKTYPRKRNERGLSGCLRRFTNS